MAIFLVIAGVIGWYAAFRLTLDKFVQLENPDSKLGCDISVIVGCSTNLSSEQGAVFGFPNPIIGLACWVVPIVIGVALLAGARFPRWFWLCLWAGFLFGLCLVAWFAFQSIYVISSLCPWCMLTWSVMIPSFFALTFHVMRLGAFGDRVRGLGATLAGWTPLITLVVFVLIAVLAQVRLDVIGSLL